MGDILLLPRRGNDTIYAQRARRGGIDWAPSGLDKCFLLLNKNIFDPFGQYKPRGPSLSQRHLCLMRSPKGRAHTAPLGAGKPEGAHRNVSYYCTFRCSCCPIGAILGFAKTLTCCRCPFGAIIGKANTSQYMPYSALPNRATRVNARIRGPSLSPFGRKRKLKDVICINTPSGFQELLAKPIDDKYARCQLALPIVPRAPKGQTRCVLALPRDAHTPQSGSTFRCWKPKGWCYPAKRDTNPLLPQAGHNIKSLFLVLLPLRGKSNICPKGQRSTLFV